MNITASTGIAFGPIVLLLLILILIPGTILGWVAAARIRRSEGKLYGLRIAAFAAMFVPTLLLILIPVMAFAVAMRIGVFSSSLQEEDSMILGAVLFATFALLSVKVFQGCLRHLRGKGTFRETFGLKRNRLLLIALALIWLVIGGLFGARLIYNEPPPKPPLEPQLEFEDSNNGLSFRPEHKMKVSSAEARSRTLFLDLDQRELKEATSGIHAIAKGRFDRSASKPPNTDQKIEEWAARWGQDLMIIQTSPKVLTALYGGPMAYRPDLDFDSSTPTQVLKAAESLPQAPSAADDPPQVTVFSTDPSETIVFRTREGGVGMLELLESPEFPKGGVVVRYKTIQDQP